MPLPVERIVPDREISDDDVRLLATKMLEQTRDDALAEKTSTYEGHGGLWPSRDTQNAARLFLTADRNFTWRLSRELWCQAAGIDPDALRERMARLLGVQA